MARRYRPSEQTLYRYRHASLAAGKAPLAGHIDAQRRIQELERAVADRERIIGELVITNRISKNRSQESLEVTHSAMR